MRIEQAEDARDIVVDWRVASGRVAYVDKAGYQHSGTLTQNRPLALKDARKRTLGYLPTYADWNDTSLQGEPGLVCKDSLQHSFLALVQRTWSGNEGGRDLLTFYSTEFHVAYSEVLPDSCVPSACVPNPKGGDSLLMRCDGVAGSATPTRGARVLEYQLP